MVFDWKMKKNNTSDHENEEKGTLRDRNAVKIFTIKIFSRKKQSCLYFTFYFRRKINLTGPKSETESTKPTINGYNFLSGTNQCRNHSYVMIRDIQSYRGEITWKNEYRIYFITTFEQRIQFNLHLDHESLSICGHYGSYIT